MSIFWILFIIGILIVISLMESSSVIRCNKRSTKNRRWMNKFGNFHYDG